MKVIRNGKIDVRMSLEELQLIYTLVSHINTALGSDSVNKVVAKLIEGLDGISGIDDSLEELDRLTFISADSHKIFGHTEIVVDKEEHKFVTEELPRWSRAND